MKGLWILGGAAALACCACRKSDGVDAYVPAKKDVIAVAAVEPGKEAILMPLQQGNQWVYEAESTISAPNAAPQTRKTEITWRVASVKQVGGGTQATIETVVNNKVVGKQVWQLLADGLYQLTDNDGKALNPKQPIIKFPPKAGTAFNWTGVAPIGGSKTGKSKSTNTIMAPQEVDTVAATYSAIPVLSESETVGVTPAQKVQSTIWFAPNVGVVRLVQELQAGNQTATSLMKLKSFTLAKSQ